MQLRVLHRVKWLLLLLFTGLSASLWAQTVIPTPFEPTCTPWSVEDATDLNAEVNSCYCVKHPDAPGCKAACDASVQQVITDNPECEICPDGAPCTWESFYHGADNTVFDLDNPDQKKCFNVFRDGVDSCCYGHKDYDVLNLPGQCVNVWSNEINSYLMVLSGNRTFSIYDGLECWLYPKSALTTVMDCLYTAFDHVAEESITAVVVGMMGITGAICVLVFIGLIYRLMLGGSRDMKKDFFETVGLLLFVMFVCFNPDILIGLRSGMLNMSNTVSNAIFDQADGNVIGCESADGSRNAASEIIDASQNMANSQGLDISGDHARLSTITLFAYFDCIMFNVLGLGDSDSFSMDKSRYLGIGALLMSVLPLGGIGMFFLALFVGVILSVVVSVTTCIMMYLVAMVALTFITIILPILMPMLFFQFSRRFFTLLVNHAFVYILIVVFNTVGVVFYINVTGSASREFSEALEEHLKVDNIDELSSFMLEDTDNANSFGSAEQEKKLHELIESREDLSSGFEDYLGSYAELGNLDTNLNSVLSGNFIDQSHIQKLRRSLSNAKGINVAKIDKEGIQTFIAFLFKFIVIHMLFAGFLRSLPDMADKLVGEGIVTDISGASKALANPEIPILQTQATELFGGTLHSFAQGMNKQSPTNQMLSGVMGILGKRK